MVKVDLPHLKWTRKRIASGAVRTWFYHRPTGEPLGYVDDLPPGTVPPEVIKKLLGFNEVPKPVLAGTFRALATRYKASPDFTSLAEATKRKYRAILDAISREYGDDDASRMTKAGVTAIRDDFKANPPKANYALAVLHRLYEWAIATGALKLAANPVATKGLRLAVKGEPHKVWPPEAIAAFLAKASPQMRLAFMVGLYTGQREADCLRMTWSDYDGKGISVRQGKTGARVWIPCHGTLKAALGEAPRGKAVTILTTASGRPWKSDHFRHKWRAAILAAGLDGYTFHGLRHTAASRLADLAVMPDDIRAITGHATREMVEHYTAQADQKRRARRAIAALPADPAAPVEEHDGTAE